MGLWLKGAYKSDRTIGKGSRRHNEVEPTLTLVAEERGKEEERLCE
jgi:hypothetical protein